MKTFVFGFLILAIIATSVQAQKLKGEKCTGNNECNVGVSCVEDACGCPIGKRHEEESHPENPSVHICRNVVGLGCVKNEDCSIDLPNAKCNTTVAEKRCICLKEDGCNGAVSLVVFSLISMLFASFAVTKF